MNRRHFFTVLAGLPILNRFAPKYLVDREASKRAGHYVYYPARDVIARKLYGVSADGRETLLTTITDPKVNSVAFEGDGRITHIRIDSAES